MVAALLGSHPARRSIAPVVFKGATIGIAAAIGYRLWILPHVDSTPWLLASIAPFLLLGGMARAHSRWAGIAFDANQVFLITSHAALPVPPQGTSAVLQGAAALWLGIGLGCLAYALYRPSAQRRLQRAGHRVWGSLEQLSRSAVHRPHGRAALMRHIFGWSRQRPPDSVPPSAGSAIAALRLLDAIVDLHRLRAEHRQSCAAALVGQALQHICAARGDWVWQVQKLKRLSDSCQEPEIARAMDGAASGLHAFQKVFDPSHGQDIGRSI